MVSPELQKEFRPAVDNALELCKQRFSGRLEAVYVGGSVAVGEAWPGESDVDWFMFLVDEPTEAERSWCKETEKALASRFPSAKEFHLNVYPTSFLVTETHMMKFIFKHNSVCLHGHGHLARIENAGGPIPAPSLELARGRLGWVKRCVNGLAEARLPDELFQGAIPSDMSQLTPSDFLASRKIIRNFVLLEGAYILMLTDDFKSFRQDDVLPRLAALYQRWQPLIRMATDVLKDPIATAIPPQRVVEEALPFAMWAIEITQKLK